MWSRIQSALADSETQVSLIVYAFVGWFAHTLSNRPTSVLSAVSSMIAACALAVPFSPFLTELIVRHTNVAYETAAPVAATCVGYGGIYVLEFVLRAAERIVKKKVQGNDSG